MKTSWASAGSHCLGTTTPAANITDDSNHNVWPHSAMARRRPHVGTAGDHDYFRFAIFNLANAGRGSDPVHSTVQSEFQSIWLKRGTSDNSIIYQNYLNHGMCNYVIRL